MGCCVTGIWLSVAFAATAGDDGMKCVLSVMWPPPPADGAALRASYSARFRQSLSRALSGRWAIEQGDHKRQHRLYARGGGREQINGACGMLQLVFTSAKKSVIARQCLVRPRRTLRLTTGTHACKSGKKPTGDAGCPHDRP
jgi:hypothetical protein